jgi:pimeloyl-ACP methyl ester carboxylesterase
LSTVTAKKPGLWALAALGMGAASMGVNLASRRQQRRWRANPDPLDGRTPLFPPGHTQMVEVDDGAHIHTIRAGPAGDQVAGPVVLVHGLTAHVDDWGPVAERLVGRGLEVVGLDLRGHGRSTRGQDPLTPARLGADLARVLEVLDLTDAVVAGHSLGGMAVQALAVDRPDLVDRRVIGLALVSTSARLGSLRDRLTIPIGARVPGFVPAVLNDTTMALGVTALSAFGPDPSLFMLRQALDSFSRCPDATRRAATAGLSGFDVVDRLPALRVPTVVICGTHDLIVPFAESERIAAAIPGAHLIAVPDAGHIVAWERPDDIATHLAQLAGRAGATG